jgi:hypothetical protein
MADAHVEYLGFTTEATSRDYVLRVTRPGGLPHDITVAISLDAFVSRRARYQDAPDICFRKLQRELAACPDGFPDSFLSVSNAELEDYRVAQAPKTPTRRFKPPVPTAT